MLQLHAFSVLPLVLFATVARSQGKPESRGPDVPQQLDYSTARLDRQLIAVRLQGPIALDGVLDEPDWDRAPLAHNFLQSEPQEGAPATYDTEVRVLYGEDHLYIGVMAFDGDPEKLVIRDRSRDFNTRSVDTFAVILDTFHDRRNAYMFQTNPVGAKYDSQFFNEGQLANRDWDGVWHVGTKVIEKGWVAEIAIPFKTVKFRDADPQTWGLNFMRRNRRLNEDSFWSPIPRAFRATRVSLAGTLEDIQGIRPGANIKVTPYLSGGFDQEATSSSEQRFDGGLDAKVGVGSGMTLDLTVNTDFSQVEADVQQVNLTRFSLFFPEKRDFFLENSGVFRFGPPENARRRSFQNSFGLAAGSAIAGGQSRGNDLLLFFSRRIGLSDDGEPVSVLGGGRLTGRLGAYQLGFLNMQTGEQAGFANGENFTVMRLKRDVFQNSDVGVMFINRDTMDSSHFNRSFGVDGNFRLTPSMDVNAFVGKTASPHLSGDDMAGRIAYTYTSNRLEFTGSYTSLEDNFNPELGFAPRKGIRRGSVSGQYRYRQRFARSWLREISTNLDVDDFTDQQGDGVSRYLNTRLSFRFQNGGFLALGTRTSREQPRDNFEIVEDVIIKPAVFDFTDRFLLLFTDPSRLVSATSNITIGDFYSGTRKAYTFGGSLRLNGRLTAEGLWSHNDVDLVEGAFSTNLVTSRVTYAFSTSMFLNALVQYNSLAREWASNIRFNWIHRPLSDVFVVYNERRDENGARLDRALIAKFTYLFEF